SEGASTEHAPERSSHRYGCGLRALPPPPSWAPRTRFRPRISCAEEHQLGPVGPLASWAMPMARRGGSALWAADSRRIPVLRSHKLRVALTLAAVAAAVPLDTRPADQSATQPAGVA